MTLVRIGYGTATTDLNALDAWAQWEPEFGRRVKALIAHSFTAGFPLGVGGAIRSGAVADAQFIARHHVVGPTENPNMQPYDWTWRGQHWRLNPGAAPCAPDGYTWHGAVPNDGLCYAADMTGDMVWMDGQLGAYGLKWVAPERWHVQPVEIPAGRPGPTYVPPVLPTWNLPGAPAPSTVTTVFAPGHDLSMAQRLTQDKAAVRHLQDLWNFMGATDSHGNPLVLDGDFGPKTMEATYIAQATKLHLGPSTPNLTYGTYDAVTHLSLQVFLNAVASMNVQAPV